MDTFIFDHRILWPVLVVVLLTLVSGFYLATQRLKAVKQRVMRLSFYRVYRDGEEPEHLAAATRHYSNLFETPVLFYMGCLVAALLGPVNVLALIAAWVFAVPRVLQSVIHLTSNRVKWRAYTFFTSWYFLVALWASNGFSLAVKL